MIGHYIGRPIGGIISAEEAVVITPALFVDDDTFYVPLIALAVQEITPELVLNVSAIPQPTVLVLVPEPVYDFPIGRSLGSDYGVRARRRRLIIGRGGK